MAYQGLIWKDVFCLCFIGKILLSLFFWLFLAPQNSTKNYSLIASAVQVINSKRIMLFVGFCEFHHHDGHYLWKKSDFSSLVFKIIWMKELTSNGVSLFLKSSDEFT